MFTEEIDEQDQTFIDLCYDHNCNEGYSTLIKYIVTSEYFDVEDSYALICANVFDLLGYGAQYYSNCVGVWIENSPQIVADELKAIGMGIVRQKPELKDKLRVAIDPANKLGVTSML